jgi:hypothetical protein
MGTTASVQVKRMIRTTCCGPSLPPDASSRQDRYCAAAQSRLAQLLPSGPGQHDQVPTVVQTPKFCGTTLSHETCLENAIALFSSKICGGVYKSISHPQTMIYGAITGMSGAIKRHDCVMKSTCDELVAILVTALGIPHIVCDDLSDQPCDQRTYVQVYARYGGIMIRPNLLSNYCLRLVPPLGRK